MKRVHEVELSLEAKYPLCIGKLTKLELNLLFH